MNLKSQFIQQLRWQFPSLQNESLENLIHENLLSQFTIKLPKAILEQAQKVVFQLYNLRETPSYLAHYKNIIAEKGLVDPQNKSIMMSYDFHIDENQNLKLIEINTNAAFLILGHQLYQAKKEQLPIANFSLQEIGENIQTELKLQGKSIDEKLKISIMDNKPQEQRLFVEFLVYNELFKTFGWDSRIEDSNDLFKSFDPDFIYNRSTDFFLTESVNATLRQKYLNQDVCLSPNPFEYLLLADKQRLIDWVQPGFLQSHGISGSDLELLTKVLPLAYDLTPANAEEIWAIRKKLFLKPKNAFGSKQSFRGSSISRKAFEDLLKDQTIAQEFVPAPEQCFETPDGPQNFKFDLRCYAYQGRLQLIIARLYQGQTTNLRTPYGGFGTVQFS